ncbi:hypothetical protein DFH07DRAFT_765316 [Mycena maculata]|uniref:Uncharacterized protein n=1 Tax=Mycena maculata TaxID=230809 RepID=A0AAD7K8W5_9AGAR|nr:hypothetical protein DFH07DRAFT_765316 [Mycena maculata]
MGFRCCSRDDEDEYSTTYYTIAIQRCGRNSGGEWQSAASRAVAKAKKRRWDPPKRPKHPESLRTSAPGIDDRINDHTSEGEAALPSEPSFRDARARSRYELSFAPLDGSEKCAAGTAVSPTSDEQVAIQALAALSRDVVERAIQAPDLESLEGGLPLGVRATEGPQEPTKWIQETLMQVLALNAGTLTPPTVEEAASWHRVPLIDGSAVDERARWLIKFWRVEVMKAAQRARINGWGIQDGEFLYYSRKQGTPEGEAMHSEESTTWCTERLADPPLRATAK